VHTEDCDLNVLCSGTIEIHVRKINVSIYLGKKNNGKYKCAERIIQGIDVSKILLPVPSQLCGQNIGKYVCAVVLFKEFYFDLKSHFHTPK
jgi:hypothetical protein